MINFCTTLRVTGLLRGGCRLACAVALLSVLAWDASADVTEPLTLMPMASEVESSLAGSYLAARHAQALRDGSRAVEFYQAALEKDPDNVSLLRRTLVVMIAEEQLDEAVGLARRLIALSENESVASIALAIDDVRNGRYAEADRRMAEVAGERIHRFVSPLVRAWAQLGDGRADDAMETLKSIGEQQGLKSLHDLHAGLILQLAGRVDAADEAFAAATAGEGARSLRVVELAGVFFEIAGEREKARSLYESYLADHPGSRLMEPALARLEAGTPPKPDIASAAEGVAQVMFDLGGVLRQQNARETALVFGRLALALKPDFPTAQLLVADILEGNGRLEGAIEVYRSIRTDSPLAYTGLLRVAISLDDLDRVDEAVSLLQQMGEDHPDQADPLITLGNILRGRERYLEAVDAYDQAIARVGTLEQRHWSLLYARGMALERSKQWGRAEVDFLGALDFEPEQPYVLNYLGYSWVDQGLHLERATKMIERAVELRPNDGYIVDSLGWAFYRLGDYEKAVRHLERAIELRPEDPVINDHLGDAYWKVGRRQEARFQWERALGLDPEPETVDEIEAKLDRGLVEGENADANG